MPFDISVTAAKAKLAEAKEPHPTKARNDLRETPARVHGRSAKG
jgi:hypothetical protein